MFSPVPFKMLFIFLLASTIFSACAFRQAESVTSSQAAFNDEELKSEIPFATKEPDNFQAEFVVSTGGAEDVTFAARNGANLRYDYNFGEKKQFSVIQTAYGKNFLVLKEKKIFAENNGNTVKAASENPFDFLTTEWLNEKPDAKFEKLGTENNFTKYRVIFGDNQKSEAIVYVDEKIGLPVKQEFYSVEGEQKTLNFTFELRNFRSPSDAGLFTVPQDFRKTSVEEFRRILHSEN